MNREELETTANLHSEELEEIMSRMPSWTERWGLLLIGLSLLGLIVAAHFISWVDF